jgi:hypothetical protein
MQAFPSMVPALSRVPHRRLTTPSPCKSDTLSHAYNGIAPKWKLTTNLLPNPTP